VHDKTVRRRRAVLALLVALSLILISASFGSSGGGPLHTVQSGFLDVLSPVETGANKVLTPVHDLFNGIDDVFNASGQRDTLRRQYSALQAKYVALQAQVRESHDAAALRAIDRGADLAPDRPVGASVIARPESVFVREVTIDAGSGAGVRRDDPVIDPDGLVGTVTQVFADSSIVTLIDDSSAREAAQDNVNGEFGLVAPDVGSPSLLTLQYVADPSRLKVGDEIVTAGARVTGGATLFPADLLIGAVRSLPPAGNQTGTITVTPSANLGALDHVQVLTAVHG
jgi:rod shape-determining protein MreC